MRKGPLLFRNPVKPPLTRRWKDAAAYFSVRPLVKGALTGFLLLVACQGTRNLGTLDETAMREGYFAAVCALDLQCNAVDFYAEFASVDACVTAARKEHDLVAGDGVYSYAAACPNGEYHPDMGYRYIACLKTLPCEYWDGGFPCAAYEKALCTGVPSCTEPFECMYGQYCSEEGYCAPGGDECHNYGDCPEGHRCDNGFCEPLDVGDPCGGLGFQCGGSGALLLYCENGFYRLDEDCAEQGKVCRNIQCVEE